MNGWRLEAKLALASPASLTVLALFFLLAGYALGAGAHFRSHWEAQYRDAQSSEQSRRAREVEAIRANLQHGRHPPGAAEGQYAEIALPPAPGALLATGTSELSPRRASVRALSRADELFRNFEMNNPRALMLGRFDLAFFVVALLPLLVVVFCHDAVAGERDAGRLSLLRAQSRSFRSVLLRRLALRMLPAQLVLAVALIAAITLGTPVWLTAIWWLASALYLSAWAALSAWLGIVSPSARIAAMRLLAVWLALVVVLPPVLEHAASSLAQAPSRFAHTLAQRETELALGERSAELVDRYLTDHPELAGGDATAFGARFFVVRTELEAALEASRRTFTDHRSRRARIAAGLRLLSPPALLDATLVELAGVGETRQRAFREQAEVFFRDFRERLREPLFKGWRLDAHDVGALPRFRFVEPDAAATPLLGILAYLFALIAVSLHTASRALRALDGGMADRS